jgi:hypothetical protein
MSWNLPPSQGEKQDHSYFSFYIFCLFGLHLPHSQHSPCAGIRPSVDFIGIVLALTPTCPPFLLLFPRSPTFFSIKILSDLWITCALGTGFKLVSSNEHLGGCGYMHQLTTHLGNVSHHCLSIPISILDVRPASCNLAQKILLMKATSEGLNHVGPSKTWNGF